MPTNPVRSSFTFTVKDFYKNYKERQIARGKEPVTYKRYKLIVKSFFKHVVDKMIIENYHFMLPYGMGVIGIKAYKLAVDSLSINWPKTIELKKLVKHVNDHSNNYSFGFTWNTQRSNFKNRIFYHFKISKQYQKSLTQRIFSLSKNPVKRSFIRT